MKLKSSIIYLLLSLVVLITALPLVSCGEEVKSLPAGTAAITVPTVQRPIPVTATSYPWLAANKLANPIDLAKSGYLEEEYFLSGKANVYDWKDDGSTPVISPNAPYTNRILVRKPADKGKFTGTVIVELLNASSGYDMALATSYIDLFIEKGWAYVGITLKPFTVIALKKFNAERYAPLSWASPRSMPSECKLTPDYSADTEEGLCWDIISQTGALLKSKDPKNPLAGYDVKYLYMYAASQPGASVLTYMNAGFHSRAYTATGYPIWNGYFVDTGHGRIKPINQCAAPIAMGTSRSAFRGLAPFFIIASESDSNAFDALKNIRDDSDKPGDQFRLYEISGSTHATVGGINISPTDDDISKALGLPYKALPYPGKEQPPNDFPKYYFSRAALVNLDTWVRTGTLPPKEAQRIQFSNPTVPEPDMFPPRFGITVKDDNGNTKGGVRSCYLDVPICIYNTWYTSTVPIPIPSGTSAPASASRGWLYGHKVMFSADKLKQIYGTHDTYVQKVEQCIDQLVKDKWMLPSDGQKIKDEAKNSNVLR